MSSANDAISLEAVFGKALLLQQEAARMGHKLSLSEDGRFMTLPLPWKASEVSLDECSTDEARALVDNVKHADCVLQVGDGCYHAHTQLLQKRSKFFQELFDTDIDKNNPVFVLDKMPSTEKHGFAVFLDYLYTGEIPNSTLLDQYGIALAKNAHYADCEELYSACIRHLVGAWREVEKMNTSQFAIDMTTLVMEDVLSKTNPDAVEDKLLFMAATYSAVNDTDTWTECVLQQITTADFAAHLTFGLLVKLHADMRAGKASAHLVKVLNLIPNALTLEASQRQVQAVQQEVVNAQQMSQCSRCCRYVTRYQAEHDPAGCVIYRHTVPKTKNYRNREVYSCCSSTSDVGCPQRQQTHTVYSGYRSYK
jgi:BTB/POZ domain